jgi:hypothetical protein
VLPSWGRLARVAVSWTFVDRPELACRWELVVVKSGMRLARRLSSAPSAGTSAFGRAGWPVYAAGLFLAVPIRRAPSWIQD